jgi:hypothetical protein
MPKQHDATIKSLVDLSPEGWLPLLGRPPAPVTVADSDNSVALSGAVDKLLRVHADPEYLLHLDFVAGHDTAQLPPRLKLYNAVHEYKYGLPVLSVAVLLHPGADSPQLTGLWERTLPGESAPYSSLRYGVLRVWQMPTEPLLTGGLGLLPLAPISNVTESEVPDVLRRMNQRLQVFGEGVRVEDIWSSALRLMGLRYKQEFLTMISDVVREFEDSPAYRIFTRRPVADALRELLLSMGSKRFGPADAVVLAALNHIDEPDELKQLAERLVDVHSWQELFTPPAPGAADQPKS